MTNESDKPDAGEPVEPTEAERGEPSVEALHTCYRRGRLDERSARERKRGERPLMPWATKDTVLGDEVHQFAGALRGMCITHDDIRAWLRSVEDWASSADSDELAKLRAELADNKARLEVAVSLVREQAQTAATNLRLEAELEAETIDSRKCIEALTSRLAEVVAERDTEKARADRAERDLDFERDCLAANQRNGATLSASLTQAKARIAELQSDRNRLYQELASHEGVAALGATALRELEAKLRVAVDDCAFAVAGRETLTKELAEAREELRLADAVVDATRGKRSPGGALTITWPDVERTRSAYDAHRAKPSPQSPSLRDEIERTVRESTPEQRRKVEEHPSGFIQSPSSADSDARNADPECINCGHVSSDHPRGEHCGACADDEDGNSARCDCSRFIEAQGKPASPTYETAPTLEKGVRYRVVESRGPYWAVGEEFVHTGVALRSVGNWFAFPHLDGVHRVVRVESAPTVGERAAAARQAIELAKLDAEESAPADDGPPRVGDTVKHPRRGQASVLETDDNDRSAKIRFDSGFEQWAPSEILNIIRRAQPLPAAIGAVAAALPTSGEGERVVDGLMAKAQEGRGEPPMRMMGPLEDRMRRLEDAALDSDELPRVKREIRAEREGRNPYVPSRGSCGCGAGKQCDKNAGLP